MFVALSSQDTSSKNNRQHEWLVALISTVSEIT